MGQFFKIRFVTEKYPPMAPIKHIIPTHMLNSEPSATHCSAEYLFILTSISFYQVYGLFFTYHEYA